MNQGTKKIIFYTTFVALGVFWAEVISTNIPYALAAYPLYVAYGLLYVIFIDTLMRWQVRDFKVWYLFGALVGIITETYIAKVIFYSPTPNAFRIFGVAPGSIVFIILSYHAFFSFLAPAYLAKRVLNMPFPISPNKWIDYSFLAVPIIMFPVVSTKLAQEGWNVLFLIRLVGISAIILSIWVLLLRFIGDIKNVLLSHRERIGVVIFTFIAYTFFLFKATNKGHGHAPMDFPVIPMIIISIIIAAIFVLIFKSISKNKEPVVTVSYSPKTINLKLFFAWLFWYILLTTILSLKKPGMSLVHVSLMTLALTLAIIGVGTFIRSIVCLFRTCLK